MDPVSISAIAVSLVGAIASLITTLHIKKCNICCCINSDCSSKTPPNTPSETTNLVTK